MGVRAQIEEYLAGQAEPKRDEMRALHRRILDIAPECRLWFLDGKDEGGKIVSNPNIGYGFRTIHYADGKSREFYQIGISANTAGISLYIMGLEDKKYLPQTYGKRIGKATVTGYCVKFKSLKNLNIDVVEEIIRLGFAGQGE
jgi:hypothetical protein